MITTGDIQAEAQRPFEALRGPGAEVALEDVDPGHRGEHERRRDRDEQAPRAHRPDHEVGLVEQPVRERQPDRVHDLGGEHEPPWEPHAAERRHGDGDHHRLSDQAQEGVREAQEVGLPCQSHGGAGDRRGDVAGQVGQGILGQCDRVDGQHQGGDQPDDARHQHLDEGARVVPVGGRWAPVGSARRPPRWRR